MSKPRAYVKRSGITGKTRRYIPVREHGERIECIADDNGRTVIIRKQRLYAEVTPTINGDTMPVSPALSALLDKWLGCNNG